jgi:hypothetical protein
MAFSHLALAVHQDGWSRRKMFPPDVVHQDVALPGEVAHLRFQPGVAPLDVVV